MTGLLLCVGTPLAPLADIAKQGAAALELANDYTDYIEAARRRKPTTPAAEVQQHLLPPRIARIAGAQLAGTLLPTYEVGGDWFDFVENRDGAWLAIADAPGNGPTAAGLGAAALGALRAARRSGQDLEHALASVHETVRHLGNREFHITALVARWRAATATLTWVNCGHPPAYVVDTDGNLQALEGPEHPPLGAQESETRYTPGQAAAALRRAPDPRHQRNRQPATRGRRPIRCRRPERALERAAEPDCGSDRDGDPGGGDRLLARTARGRRDRRRHGDRVDVRRATWRERSPSEQRHRRSGG